MYDLGEGKGVLLWVKQDKGRLGRNYNYRASTFLGRGDRRDGGESLAKSNRLRIQSVENRAQKAINGVDVQNGPAGIYHGRNYIPTSTICFYKMF